MKERAPTLFLISALVTSLLILPVTPMLKTPAAAQSAAQVRQVRLSQGALRTVDDMLVDQATAAFPSVPGGEVPLLPGMDPAQYAAAKAAAALAPLSPRPKVPAAPLAVAVGSINCDGEDQTLAANINGTQFFPPDADGAVGVSQFVQTTNVHVTAWDKEAAGGGCPDLSVNPLLDIDLNSFFGYLPPTYPNASQLFDSRVVHDDVFGRWVIISEGFPEGGAGTPQVQFIAVSQGEDATDSYFIFSFNTRALLNCGTCFWDFPQLGYDGQAIILTANVFNPGFTEGHLVFIKKQDLYQGFGPLVCSFSGGLLPSWAPPKVVGGSTATWLAEAAPSGSVLALARFTSTGQFCPPPPVFSSVTVPAYTVPISASQPGTTQRLDTLDARFQNRSTQVGDGFLWNTHTTNDSGLPTPRLYRIRLSGPGSPVVEQTIDYFASGSSHDFNPSIAANSQNTVAVTWSSTDAGFGINAQVRVGAKTFAGTSISQALVFQSSVPLTGNFSSRFGRQRWGDYSSTTIDPTNSGLAWGVNEEIDNPDDSTGRSWGTRFFNATIP